MSILHLRPEYITQLRQKLNRTNGLLEMLSYQVSSSLLKPIYFVIFDSQAQVWGQGDDELFCSMVP